MQMGFATTAPRAHTHVSSAAVAILSSKLAKSRGPTTISRGARPVVANEMTVRAMWMNLRRRFGTAMLASVAEHQQSLQI
jgi:hypothetical protein